MRLIDRGAGTPVLVIPGIQGRWEWMRPTIEAMAGRCRVLTYSLADEPSARWHFDESRGFQAYVDQARDALDAAGVQRAAICGISYGGLVAAAFAARHPERTASLVLVSAISPDWRPNARARFYLRAPRLLTPLFMIASLRLWREIAAASGGAGRGLVSGVRHVWRVLTHMFRPTLMARRVHMLKPLDLRPELAHVSAPVFVITGDPSLERVVPVSDTRRYLQIWPDARTATIARTGHLGSITRPDEFTRLVVPFAEETAGDGDARRRIG